MSNTKRNVIIGAGLATLTAILLSSGKKEEEQGDGDGDEGGETTRNRPTIGFSPAIDPLSLLGVDGAELERLLAERKPVDLKPWEEPKNIPTCGLFHKMRRKDRLCGERNSICQAALYRVAYKAARDARDLDPEKFARNVADNPDNRVKYAYLMLSGTYNDTHYATWGYCASQLPGPHGRAFILNPCHADNRKRMSEGQAPIRTIPLCAPQDKGTGIAAEQATGEHRPYVWMPLINTELLYESGEITTRGVTWPDGSTGIEPPPEVMRLVLKGLVSRA